MERARQGYDVTICVSNYYRELQITNKLSSHNTAQQSQQGLAITTELSNDKKAQQLKWSSVSTIQKGAQDQFPLVPKIIYSREYSRIYRGPILRFSSAPRSLHPNPAPVSNLSLFLSLPWVSPASLLTWEGGRGGGNHSILSGAQKRSPRLSNRDMIHHTPIFCPAACFDPIGLTHIAPHPPLYHVFLTWCSLSSYLVPRNQTEEKVIKRNKGAT